MVSMSRPRLQRKLTLSYCLILLLPVTLISAFTLLRTREALIARASAEQLSLAEARATAAESLLADVSGDLLLLTQAPAVHRLGNMDSASRPVLRQVEGMFLNVLRGSSDRYAGLCLLDPGGQERLCADVITGQPITRSARRLGNQIDAPAFVNALRLVSIPGRLPVAISVVAPARAGGVPTIAYSTVLSDDSGRIAGVLVLDALLDPLIDLLVDRSPQTRTFIVDSAGSFLLHPGPAPAASLQEDRPRDAAQILRQPSGALLDTLDRPDAFQVFARVRPRGHAAIQWTVIYERPVTAVTGEIGRAQGLIVLVALAGLGGAVLMAAAITRGITRPLTALAAAAERVGAGALDTPFPPAGSDEIGALSATFARTVGRLRETIAAAERRTREAETLRAAASALGGSLDRRQVLQTILDELGKVVPYDSASVQLLRNGRSEIIGGYGYLDTEQIIGRSFVLTPGATPNAEVVARRATVIYANAPDHFPHFREEPYRADPICAWMGVPLIHREDLIGMITLDRHGPASFDESEARLAAAFAAHAAVAIENARLYEAAHTELAERRRAEAAHARLAVIIEATPDFVGTADLAGRPLFINRAGRQMLGLGPDDELGAYHITDFMAPAARPLLVDQALPAALAEGVWLGELDLLHRDGRAFPVSQVIIAHYDAAGRPEFLSTVVRDISERRRAEEQQRQSQKMEALGRLAGGLAHDFNNILTVINGESELLADELPAESALRVGLEQIQGAAGRAAALTGQLLAFSRRQVLQPSVLNLNDCIVRAGRMLERLIGEDISLTMELDPGLALVRVDPSQVELVLMNLAINARDAMPDGGSLEICTTNLAGDPDGPAGLLAAGAGAWVELRVSDSGAGMDRETLSHIFEPFFTTKPRGKGTGLGLATVLGVVQQSGGDIVCESAPGRGSMFRIVLPATEGAPGVRSAGPASLPAPAQGTVLLVEDNAEVRRFARLVLERQGCRVIEAADGAAALAAAQREPIDLLLTDIIMPGGLNGVQLARRMRQERPAIRILYMSGYSDNAQVGQSIAADGAHYLQKPFSPAELALALHQALDSPAPQV